MKLKNFVEGQMLKHSFIKTKPFYSDKDKSIVVDVLDASISGSPTVETIKLNRGNLNGICKNR